MRKTTLYPLSFFLLFFFMIFNLNSQSTNIIEDYEDYTEAPREIAYAHLNKSTYIEGEMMGFTAYVFDKYTKESSKITRNLYCTISDETGKIVKKKLIKVDNGVTSNVFDIDSTLSTGIFTFKAYTNWMRNFDEQNHFQQTFKVIDADNLKEIKPTASKDIKIDIQALGEGGHIVYNVLNSVGIIAKNQFGYGIANAYGTIKNESGYIVSEFQLNEVGLAKTLFKPLPSQIYTINLNLNEREVSTPINSIKAFGISLNLFSTKENISLKLSANQKTLVRIKNKEFKIALHNGDKIVLAPFKFSKDGTAILTFSKKELFDGINIFTVFNDEKKPILERLYLNIESINQRKVSNATISKISDSLNIELNFKGLDLYTSSYLSVSILPTATKSYNHHNNLLSQLYLQPYVKGIVQNSKQYFLSNDRKTDYNRDLLMLTQGWSSYNWNTIFSKNERKFIHPFERGIDIVANINQEKTGSYLVYPLAGNNTQLFDVPKDEKAFTVKKTFPTEDDIFRVAYMGNKKGLTEKPSLYIQYYPSKFSFLNNDISVIKEEYTTNEASINKSKSINAWDNTKTTELDEVIIKAETKKTKIEALQRRAITERYKIIDDNLKIRSIRLDIYLQRLGYATYYDIFQGTLTITNPRTSGTDAVPLIYLDNALLTTSGVESDFSVLTFLTTNNIDYIEYQPYGYGGGLRGAAGYIKIFTGPTYQALKPAKNIVNYKVPLTFSNEKQFYTPKYQYYNSDFFNEYGTIDWKPKISINDNGIASFKIFDTKTDNITLFVEGVINGSEYISQKVNIERGN